MAKTRELVLGCNKLFSIPKEDIPIDRYVRGIEFKIGFVKNSDFEKL